jgi:hypothetical protein
MPGAAIRKPLKCPIPGANQGRFGIRQPHSAPDRAAVFQNGTMCAQQMLCPLLTFYGCRKNFHLRFPISWYVPSALSVFIRGKVCSLFFLCVLSGSDLWASRSPDHGDHPISIVVAVAALAAGYCRSLRLRPLLPGKYWVAWYTRSVWKDILLPRTCNPAFPVLCPRH